MRRILFATLLLAACSRNPEPADLVLLGGRIHCFAEDDGGPTVQALAIRGGAIVARGSDHDIERYAGATTRRIDLQGATVLPGLTDAHAHIFNHGRILQRVDLRGTESVEEILGLVQARDAALPAGEWLFGRGWDQNDWDNPFYPTRGMLDAVVADRPIYLDRIDGHAGWANSAALRAAGIDASTPDPEGGEIVRDPGTGEPTGILIDKAEDLLLAATPKETPEQLDRILAAALADCRAKGLVGVHEMGVTLEEWQALQRADARGELAPRIVAYLGGDKELRRYQGGPVRPDASGHLRLEGVKLYADGALGSRGAALLADYSDRPGHRGLLQESPEELQRQAENAMRRGFPVAIHAIGDRGNRVALDAIERASAVATELRGHRIEHVQVLNPDDFDRFHQLGVIPSMQPTHCTSDMPWAPTRIGDDRIRGAYAWRALRDRGNLMPLGSDFPVERVSPLLGLYAAVTRRGLDGEPQGGWSPEQALTRAEAVLGFSAWAAETIGVSEWGRLRVGDRADLTILDRDPLEVPVDDIPKLEVRGVVIDGLPYGSELAPSTQP